MKKALSILPVSEPDGWLPADGMRQNQHSEFF